MLDEIKRLFEYENWALEQDFATLDGVTNDQALAMLAHLLAAKQIWLVRLNARDSSSLKTHPLLSLSECRILSEDLNAGYENFISSLDDVGLNSTISYKNTKGQEFTTSIGDILLHVAFHSAYHRGQIALLLRENGDTAVNTDFISFTRL